MTVELVLPTYDRTKELKLALASLVAQTDGDWLAHVVIDSHETAPAEAIVKEFNDSRIRYTYLDKRYNDWGHTPREYGKMASGADYVVMTGDDCYYVPVFIEELKKAINENDNPEFIYWDMIHSHYGYTLFKTSPWISHIDMGAFATRIDIAKQIVLGKGYAADGEFVMEMKDKFPNITQLKINKVLFVHN